MRNVFLVAPVIFLLSACRAYPPSINILGAYFPDWIFCLTGGCVSTFLLYLLLEKQKITRWLVPYILSFPALVALFSMCYWLIFF